MKPLITQFLMIPILCTMAYAQSMVSGILVDSAQKEIGDAYVIIGIVPAAPPAVTAPFFSTTITGRDGSFRFGNVPAGEFRICTQTPGKKFLNSCDWLDKSPTVKTDGKAAADVGKIVLQEGYLLEVDIKDLQGLVGSYKKRQQEAHLGFAVKSSNRFHVLLPSLGKAADSQYSFVVPFDTDLELSIQASFFVVADEENKSEARGNQLIRKLRFAKNDPPKPIKVAVNGVGAAK